MHVVHPICLAALAAFSLSLPANAQQSISAAVLPAMDLFVDDLMDLRNTAVSCSKKIDRAKIDEEWTKMSGSLIATLWANDFPDDFTEGVEARMAAPAADTECGDFNLTFRAEMQARGGWDLRFKEVFPSMGAEVIPHPVTAEIWSGIEVVAKRHSALEAQVLACGEAQAPFAQPIEVASWMAIVGRVGQTLHDAGARHPDVEALLSSLDPNQLWHRTAPAAKAAVIKACNDDRAWFDYTAKAGAQTLPSEIEALLPPR